MKDSRTLEALMNLSLPRLGVALSSAAVVLLGGGVAAVAASIPSPSVEVADEVSTPPTAGLVDEDANEVEVEVETDDPADSDDVVDNEGATDTEGATDAEARGVGPDAAGPAHHGLCTAWAHVQESAGRAGESTAFRNLQEIGCGDTTTQEEPPVEEEPQEGTTTTTTTATAKGKSTTKSTGTTKAKADSRAKGRGSSAPGRTTARSGRG